MEMRFATDVFGDMPLFIGDNLKGIFSYDSYLELLDKYEVLPDGTAYDEIPFEEFISIVRQMLLQTEENCAIDHSVSDRLCDILRGMNIADWCHLRKAREIVKR